jgi:hypothetical protein
MLDAAREAMSFAAGRSRGDLDRRILSTRARFIAYGVANWEGAVTHSSGVCRDRHRTQAPGSQGACRCERCRPGAAPDSILMVLYAWACRAACADAASVTLGRLARSR